MTDRKKPGVAFWGTVALVVMFAYPLSFGPACWLTSRLQSGNEAASVVYQPLFRIWWNRGQLGSKFVRSYGRFGAPKDWDVFRKVDEDVYSWKPKDVSLWR